LEHLKDEIERL